MSEFWPFPLTSYHLSELSFDWVFFLQIQNLSLFYHFPKLLNFSSPGTDTASTKPFLEAGPHWNLQVLSKFYHLTELVFIEKYPYHLSELSYEWVIFLAPSARFYHMTELSYDRITTVVVLQMVHARSFSNDLDFSNISSCTSSSIEQWTNKWNYQNLVCR